LEQCKKQRKLDDVNIDMLCQLFGVEIGGVKKQEIRRGGTADAETNDVHVDNAFQGYDVTSHEPCEGRTISEQQQPSKGPAHATGTNAPLTHSRLYVC
jgi:hypothetical protein